MNSKPRRNSPLLHDIAIVFLSILLAVILAETGIVPALLTQTKGLEAVGSFIAGIFFTSIFTTAPVIVALGELARAKCILLVAFFGALGAVVGDLLLFRFMRDRLTEHLAKLLAHRGGTKRIKALFKLRFFRWATLFVGGLIIASPIPDEVGITLLGFSKLKTAWFIPLSFTFNFLGIVIIGLVARAV